MALKHQGLGFIVYLGALSALPPLSIDMGLAGIPAIESTFANAAGRGPLTLSLFLVGFALSPLVCGPIADRFGRRPTLLVGLGIFLAAAAAAACAGSFGVLLAVRLVQGLAAGACAVLPFAVVRDVFDGTIARNRLSQVSAVLGVAPMVAPILGSWVMTFADWRAIYAAQAVTGLILLGVAIFGFAETLPAARRRSLNAAVLLGSYRMVIGNRTFRDFTLIYAFGFACMFCFIAGSPAVLMRSFGLSSHVFAVLFALTACGVLLGSLASARLSSLHVPSRTILLVGLPVMAACAVGAAVLAATGVARPATLIPLVALVIFCFGLTGPSLNHEALGDLGHVAGAASGIMRFTQMVMGAAVSALIALLEPFGHPALIMTLIMAGCGIAAIFVFALQARVTQAGQVPVTA